MTKNEILKILENAKDKNGDVPIRLVRQAFEKLPIECEDAVSRTELLHIFEENCYPVQYDHNSIDIGMTLPGIVEVLNIATSVIPKRKTGKWLDNYQYGYKCSECGAYLEIDCGDVEMNFCPNCNADMRGKQDE